MRRRSTKRQPVHDIGDAVKIALAIVMIVATVIAWTKWTPSTADRQVQDDQSEELVPEMDIHIDGTEEAFAAAVIPLNGTVSQLSSININVYNDDTGQIMEMDLEDYVYHVLAAEMPASYEMEALKAQAVAARTFTIYKLLVSPCKKKEGACVCTSSNHCQAFATDEKLVSAWASRYEEYEKKLRWAVQQTKGMIVTYEDAPIQTLYHAASAGFTEDVENVYSQELPYLRSVSSPEQLGKYDAYEQSYSRKQFISLVNRNFADAKLSDATLESKVAVVNRFDSGRVDTVKLGGDIATGKEFRQALDLKSTNFTITISKDEVVVKTWGYGHGVGMSQMGANEMAIEGSDWKAIMMHYYTDVKLDDYHKFISE